MIGTISNPIASPATPAANGGLLMKLGKMSWTSGLMKVRANSPSATVGMPASTSSTGFTTLRTREGAYSLRKTAESSPIGTANTRAHRLVLRVPMTMLSTPKVASAWFGAHVSNEKKSRGETDLKKSSVGVNSEITIAVVVRTEITAQAASATSITFSPRRARAATRGRAGSGRPRALVAAVTSRASIDVVVASSVPLARP
jgi:hypothetical protein